MKIILVLLAVFFMTGPAHSQSRNMEMQEVLIRIRAELEKNQGHFAVAFKDLQTGNTILWNEHDMFHAASTMKTPVMMEVFKQAASGRLSLRDSVLIRNEFRSIADSSIYSLRSADDSEAGLYDLVGTKMLLSELVYRMIIMSSNLATNIIIGMVDGKNVTQSMRELGAMDIQVLRGVEDNKAFAKGLNNTTTAYDLMLIFENMATGKAVSPGESADMIRILLDQKYNTIIPAKLPEGVKVAHKTGFITGLHHDSGIVFLPDGRKYVLVLLSRNLLDENAAVESMANVSKMLYDHVMSKSRQ